MAGDLDSLIFDLVEWVARTPRSQADVIDAWRTSCPRLTVWEDAMDRGLLTRDGHPAMVRVTEAGRRFLAAHHQYSEPQNARVISASS